jgi:outer membrane protein OmpA-like peptidoglycan-associated protein
MQDNIDFSKTDYKILDKVIGIMLKYPNIKVSINVHTDSNGLVAYNQTMTQDRADLVLNYLINNGIDSERLTAEGHGSSKLLNHCTPSVKCYEAEHRVNRRTEFIVF